MTSDGSNEERDRVVRERQEKEEGRKAREVRDQLTGAGEADSRIGLV